MVRGQESGQRTPAPRVALRSTEGGLGDVTPEERGISPYPGLPSEPALAVIAVFADATRANRERLMGTIQSTLRPGFWVLWGRLAVCLPILRITAPTVTSSLACRQRILGLYWARVDRRVWPAVHDAGPRDATTPPLWSSGCITAGPRGQLRPGYPRSHPPW